MVPEIFEKGLKLRREPEIVDEIIVEGYMSSRDKVSRAKPSR